MFHSTIGLVHLISALFAMLTGAVVLLNTKGGKLHVRIGYAYVVGMLALNATAFMIYDLFGKFGPFHWLALVSLISIVGGMVPTLLRKQVKDWLYWHYYFMNWSVVGLYAAFWAELFTRTLPGGKFWYIVVAASGITAFIGSRLIRRNVGRLVEERMGKG
ncbi:MAG: DUF2306 domain-containing protein [Cytophagales bacterium]|nr:MAG: DUF2306 domain-containing protein [Cytophagales bacterium]